MPNNTTFSNRDSTVFSCKFLVRNKLKTIQYISAFILSGFVFDNVLASADSVVFYDKTPSAYELAKTLYPPKTRSIILDDESNSNSGEVKVAFVINFEFDSTYILAESMPYLDSLGDMLNFKRLQNKKLMVEGHADANGNSQYNLRLSEKRATAIKRYLVSIHNIDPARLYTLGQGEKQPMDHAHPYSKVNRRAEFKPWHPGN